MPPAPILVLVAVLLVLQPSVRPARADEPTAGQYVVGGVAGATLRAEPNGTSSAVGIVPAGSVVSQAGPDVVANGVAWRQVRTTEGVVGFVPAGFLVALGGPGPTGGPAASPGQSAQGPAPQAAQAGAPAPDGAVGTVPQGSVGAGPSTSRPAAEAAVASGSATSSASGSGAIQPQPADQGQMVTRAQPATTRLPAPAPTASPTPVRTVTERRRGEDVQIAQIDEETAPDGRRMAAGRINVGFKPGASQPNRLAAHRAAGTVATASAGLPDVAVAEVTPGTVSQALAAYRSRPDVAWAEPDYVRRVALTPNDPQFPAQYGPQKIGAPIAWDVTTGQPSTRIAILDCGIYSESSTYRAPDGLTGHPDLRGKIEAEMNFSNATTGADDWCNHGTLMAGIAAASASNGIGITGVGFNVRLLNGKVLNDTGHGLDSWVASGIVWATDNGAQVISLSLGGDGVCSQTMQSAVSYAWSRGAVVVAAAGNGGSDSVGDPASESPGSCSNAIAVGAIDQHDNRASFSNYGPAVPLAAPGVNVLSTNFIGTYGAVSGTSPATPHVAAVAGLLWSTPFGTSNQAIVDRLFQTADPIVGTGTLWSKGRVNAAAAVAQVACSPRPPVTVTTAASDGALNVTVTVSGPGNSIRFLEVGPGSGQNAVLTFPGTTIQNQGAMTYVPTRADTTMRFQLQRAANGQPTTQAFTVVDACGSWKTFAGGGASAGF